MDEQSQSPDTGEIAGQSIVQPEVSNNAAGVQSTASPTPPPSAVITGNPEPRHKGRKMFWAVLVLAVLALAGAAAWYWLVHNKAQQSVASNTTTGGAGCAPKSSTAVINGVNIKYIDISCTLQKAKNGKVGELVSAQGNYVYADTSGNATGSGLSGGKLIYNGRQVYAGDDLNNLVYVLSQNGQHYAYARGSATTNDTLYVDAHKVATGSIVEPVAVSNNGRDYAYVTTDFSTGNTNLYKADSLLYSSGKNLDPHFSADLSQYIGVEQISDTDYGVLQNGKAVVTTSDPNLQVGISPNGRHSIYAQSSNVVVDGKLVNAANQSLATSVAVTDSGQYGYAVCSLSQGTSVYINTKSYGVGGCSGQPAGGLVLSADGNHFLFGAQNYGWALDGQKVTMPGEVAGTEFVGDTLYVYRWAN